MTEKELKNKCDFCGLKQTFTSDTKDLFPSLRLLFEKGIIKHKFPRKLYGFVGSNEEDREDFCLISHPSWSSKEQPCDAWQLAVGLQKNECLAINLASESTRSAKETERLTSEIRDMTSIIKWLTQIIAVFTTTQIFIVIIQFINWLF